MKSKNVSLPRETNIAKVRSVFSRSLRLCRKAREAHATHNNGATLSKRIERALAAWAQSRRVAFVRILVAPGKATGAARTAKVRKAARIYREAIKTWEAYYRGHHEG